MNRSALLTLYRSLTRHRLYAILNIGGLALGIAVFLVLFLFVQFERGYDRVLPGSEKLWLVESHFHVPGTPNTINLSTSADLLTQLRAEFPGVTGTRLLEKKNVAVRDGDTVVSEDIAMVDADFFTLFRFEGIQGDPIQALSRPDAAVVTRTAARKYLGSGSPIGKAIRMEIDGESRVYRVAAVLADIPADVTFKSNIFVPLPKAAQSGTVHWGADSLNTFLRLPDSAAAAALERQMPAFIDRHPSRDMGPKPSKFITLQFSPLQLLHLKEPRERAVVAALGIVGLLTLLIATVNYVNLATARAGLRAREVAVRKVLGATRPALIAQFMSEAIAAVAIAALVGLALAEVTLPFVNSIGGSSLAIHYAGPQSIILPLLLLILFVGSFAGLYPAFVLSRFRAAAVLASARTPGGGRAGARLRQGLVVLQFAIAIAFTISTAILVAQTQHLRSADLGFERNGLVLVPSFLAASLDDSQRADLLRAFADLPGVVSVGRSKVAPTGGSFDISNFSKDDGQPGISVQQVDTGPGFLRTYDAHLLAGRFFDPAYALDDVAGQDGERRGNNIIINRTAMKTLGFASPAEAIGKRAKLRDQDPNPMIVGVIEDMRFFSPREPIAPILYSYDSQDLAGSIPSVRATPGQLRAVLQEMEESWKQIAPAVPYRAQTVDSLLYDRFYKEDDQRGRLFTIGAVLAVVIGCIGLYGLASFDTARRVREIGIRKTLGASTREIMQLLIGQFMRPVLLANIIAWPLAFLAMRQWLTGFDDRIALSPLYFLAASAVAVLIAAVTVFGQAWRAARGEPARALRYE